MLRKNGRYNVTLRPASEFEGALRKQLREGAEIYGKQLQIRRLVTLARLQALGPPEMQRSPAFKGSRAKRAAFRARWYAAEVFRLRRRKWMLPKLEEAARGFLVAAEMSQRVAQSAVLEEEGAPTHVNSRTGEAQ